jgi:hypothetical protein
MRNTSLKTESISIAFDARITDHRDGDGALFATLEGACPHMPCTHALHTRLTHALCTHTFHTLRTSVKSKPSQSTSRPTWVRGVCLSHDVSRFLSMHRNHVCRKLPRGGLEGRGRGGATEAATHGDALQGSRTLIDSSVDLMRHISSPMVQS